MPAPSNLSDRHCVPLRGPEHRLDGARIDEHLSGLAGWALSKDQSGIEKTFRFDNYYQTMAFVNALAYMAHREDHHPDLGVHYNRVHVRYSTHDVGGLSENDFICAAKVELLGG